VAVASTGQLADEVSDAVADKHKRERQRDRRILERPHHAAPIPVMFMPSDVVGAAHMYTIAAQ